MNLSICIFGLKADVSQYSRILFGVCLPSPGLWHINLFYHSYYFPGTSGKSTHLKCDTKVQPVALHRSCELFKCFDICECTVLQLYSVSLVVCSAGECNGHAKREKASTRKAYGRAGLGERGKALNMLDRRGGYSPHPPF